MPNSDDTPTKKEINKAVTAFLKDYRESASGWPEVTDEDMDQLKEIIDLLVRAKCGTDADGDRPIEWRLVNRRKERFPGFENIPYEHGDRPQTPPVEAKLFNFQLAVDEMGGLLRDISLMARKGLLEEPLRKRFE